LQQAKLTSAFGIILSVSLVLLIHQMVFLHFMAFLFFWVVFTGQQWKERLVVFGWFILAIVLSMLWPYFNPIEISYAAVTGTETRWDGNYSDVKLKAIETGRQIFFGRENFISTLGLAISGYALAFFVKRNIRWPLLVFLLFCTVMWHFGRSLHLPTSGYRWAMPTIFALQFIYAHHLAFALDKITTVRPRLSPVYILSFTMIITTILVSFYNLRTQMWQTLPQLKSNDAAHFTSTQQLVTLLEKLNLDNKGNEIIFADHRVSYTLVGLDTTPVIFSRKYNATNTQVLDFYSDKLTVTQQQAVLNQLKANIIIVDKTQHSSELITSVLSYTTLLGEQGRYAAYRL